MGVIPDKRFMEQLWAYYFLQTIDLMTLTKATTMPSIRKSAVAKLLIPLPPLSKQKRMITYLDRIRKTVESLKKLQQGTEEDLEKLVPTIVDRAFKRGLW